MSESNASALSIVIARFEDAWWRGERPAIDSYLAVENADHETLLLELVHVDLELRLKGGDTVRVENYLRRYPQLAGDRFIPLIVAEYELRKRREPEVMLDEYYRRFPAYQDQLRQKMEPAPHA